jgi:Cof subfamily protein (haloacid dehalogenase superfamily)
LQTPQIIGDGHALVSPSGELIECLGYLSISQMHFGRNVFERTGIPYLFYGTEMIWFEEGKVKESDRSRLVKLGESEPLPVSSDEANHLDKVIKLLAFCNDDEQPATREETARKTAEERDDLRLYRSNPQFLEIARAEINKGLGLRRLMEMLSIDPVATAVVGDSENDLGMFEVAGLAVAMGQASPEVKARAGYVTTSNSEDGVARFIEEYQLA